MLIASLPSPLIAAEITNPKENLTQDIFDSSFDLTLKVEDTGWSPTEEQKNWDWTNKNVTILPYLDSGSAQNGIYAHDFYLTGHLNSFIVSVNPNEPGMGDHAIWDEDANGKFSIEANLIQISAQQHGFYIATPAAAKQSSPYDFNLSNFEKLTIEGGSGGKEGSGIVINRHGEMNIISHLDNSIIRISTQTKNFDHDAAISNKTNYDTTENASSVITLQADHIILNQDQAENTGFNGIYSGQKSFKSEDTEYIDSQINLTGTDIQVYGSYFGIIQNEKGTVSLNANDGSNLVKLTAPTNAATNAGNFLPAAIRAGGEYFDANVNLTAATNTVSGADGQAIAVYAEGKGKVQIEASEQNHIFGALVSGKVPNAPSPQSNSSTDSTTSQIIFTGNTALTSSYTVKHTSGEPYSYILGALAMTGGSIEFQTGSQVLLTTALQPIEAISDSEEEDLRERVAWAYGGAIELDGTMLSVHSEQGVAFDNSVGIALVASDGGLISAQNLMTGSRIVGDIVGGIEGTVNLSLHQGNGTYVRRDIANTDADIFGNVLAANGGTVNLELGKGVVWLGRADDYRDASTSPDATWTSVHKEFFAPQFSDAITEAGNVSIKLNEGAIWSITGQSWVTTLAGQGGIIDLSGSSETASHALRVWNLEGSHTFVLDLNHVSHETSDMLYLQRIDPQTKTSDAEDNQTPLVQTIVIENIQGLEKMAAGDKIRFATVNGNLSFRTAAVEGEADVVHILDQGMLNPGFVMGSEDYDPEQTDGYNGSAENGNETKPGDSWTDAKFSDGTNWFLTRDPSKDEHSDAAFNAFSTAKANYRTAVYMDTLNKRQGEARFSAGEDDGFWARLRRDQINQDGDFHSHNLMAEIGYDVLRTSDSGFHRTGIALDYMDGSIDFDATDANGDIKRWGAWLYNTWIGDDGQYTDIVFKWGRLSNDFAQRAASTSELVSGGYHNDVFSISGEYGIKFEDDDGNYVEPQAQLQYSRVTSASYATSQGSQVHLDAIDSWIGRIGARVGHAWRDNDSGMDLYLKADLLHEFDGEQRLQATDNTGLVSWRYDNEGTWGDFGLGFSYRTDKDSYAFCDLEKMVGNSYGSSWQISAGLRINF